VKEVVTGEPERVLREAQAAARLNHPGIVTLYELGERSGRAVLVSELVPGATLAELREAGGLSDRDVGELAADLCDALAHAHSQGVVHRDVKPENVIVRHDAHAGKRAKLMDFGVARIAGARTLTAAGEVVGTLAYMSPEQAEGLAAGPPSDVYSLGLTLYEAWSGEHPVAGATPAETARRIGNLATPLREVRPDLPPAIATAIDACLDPDPGVRPDPRELRDRLEPELRRLDPDARIPTPADLSPASPRARERLFATAAVASAALAAPVVGVAAATPALVGIAPRAVMRAILGLVCWAWALVVTDAAVGAEAFATGLVFAAAAISFGPLLAARHVAVALVGTVLWAAAYDAALRLVGDSGLGAGPLVLAGAGATVIALEFGIRREREPRSQAPVAPGGGRALSRRLAAGG
jgi:serine/threonine-protein kinase